MIKNLKEEVTKFIYMRKAQTERVTFSLSNENIGNAYITIIKDKTDGSTPSDVYVRNKTKKLRERLGENFVHIIEIDETTDLGGLIQRESDNKDCVGLIVQKPSIHYSDDSIQMLCAIHLDPTKDIDSITPKPLGDIIALESTRSLPLTARGMIKFLDHLMNNCQTHGKVATVIGRSVIVGKPTVMALINRGYSVFSANSRTDRAILKDMLLRSDVIISAVGKHGVITNNYVKPGAIILDVGINRDENGKLCGDLRIDDTGSLSFSYTPVPGGIGKITSNEFYCKVIRMAYKHVFEGGNK